MDTQTHHDQDVESATRAAVQALRSALVELFADLHLDPARPQDVSRKLGLHRNLTWKLSRVLGAEDPFASLHHLPGQQGFDLTANAFELAGAQPALVSHVRDAVIRLDSTAHSLAGGWEHLTLLLESMGLIEPENQVVSGREYAFRGNSSIWGVQAKTRFGAIFLAPSFSNPALSDAVILGGIAGFQRLRPSAQWRLFRMQVTDDTGAPLASPHGPHAVFSDDPADIPYPIAEFCSPNTPKLITRDTPDGREFLLPHGPVGPANAFDCITGMILRNLPSTANPQNRVGSAASAITIPSESFVFDVVMHRAIRHVGPLEFQLFGYPHGGADLPPTQTNANLLPIRLRHSRLAGPPPALATPAFPSYGRLARRIFERFGWNAAEFNADRVQLAYPPMSSRFVVKWNLPDGDAP